MVRLCILLGSVGLGGAQPATAALAEDLASAGFDLRFFCFGQPDKAAFAATMQPRMLGTRFATGLLPTRAALADFRPQVVLSSLGIASLAVELARATLSHRFAHAAWVHGYPEQEAGQFSHPLRKAAIHLSWRAIARADRILAVSDPLAAHLRTFFPGLDMRIRAIPNGPVHSADFGGNVSPIRSTDAPKRLIFAGRFAVDKAPLDAIAAMALLPSEMNVRLDFYGEGPLEGAMRAAIQTARLDQRIAIHPPTRDLPAMIAQSDALVLPSPLEPFGNVVIEAYAQGVPVIVRRGSGGPESLVPDGARQSVTADHTIADLAATIQRTLVHPPSPEQLLAQAQLFSRERHSAAMANALQDLAKDV